MEGKRHKNEEKSIEAMRVAWLERAEKDKKAEVERRQAAMAKANAIARYLKEKYKVRAVYLYGSLVWGKHFTVRSDIDLLVKGFPTESSYWRMLVEAEALASPFEVNIVTSEDAMPSLGRKAESEGMLL